jgi:hypothetical protein
MASAGLADAHRRRRHHMCRTPRRMHARRAQPQRDGDGISVSMPRDAERNPVPHTEPRPNTHTHTRSDLDPHIHPISITAADHHPTDYGNAGTHDRDRGLAARDSNPGSFCLPR